MQIIKKDATITNTDEEFPGSFEVVLSAPTEDRDGETLLPEEWKQPLPQKITFDSDHGMSVASTVGSGTPSINEKGELVVSGTYSSLPRAQEVRTLVNEGHINTTSVAFMSDRSEQKDGKTVVKRELLNGAFVAIPSNREALVLSSKGIKAGARNSQSDAEHIQAIHDHAVALGATADDTKSFTKSTVKSVEGSLEAAQDRARDALNDAYGTGAWVWLQATLPDSLVFEISVEDSSDSETYQQSYTDDGSVVTLTGERVAVDLTQIVKPDPDEDAADSGADETPASGAAEAAPVAGAKAAPVEDADSDAVTAKDLEEQALQIQAAQFI
jgi:hypothetical protein